METATLEATGYDWTCPGCGKANYESKRKFEVACPKCKRAWPVTEVKHKGDPDGELVMIKGEKNGAVLTASAYSFDCPECDTENFVEKPVNHVKCKFCKYEGAVGGVTHGREERKGTQKPAIRVIEKPVYGTESQQMAMF